MKKDQNGGLYDDGAKFTSNNSCVAYCDGTPSIYNPYSTGITAYAICLKIK